MVLCLLFLFLVTVPHVSSKDMRSKPVVKPPLGNFKAVLSVDGGGMRNLIGVMVLVEVEQRIKRYLLQHPELLPSEVNDSEDFEVELADYFDVMTGNSAGGWVSMYLASRGGKGFARSVLDNPAVVEKYGVLPTGSAAALRVFFKEFGFVIYPSDAYNLTAGPPLDITNPLSTGVSTTVYEHEGIETAMGAFVGNLTMEDLDTSVMISAYDLLNGVTVLFVQNTFGDIPVSSTARMTPRVGPRQDAIFEPDLEFETGANYYLTDVAAATASVPVAYPAKPVRRVGDEDIEFLMVDGVIALETTGLVSAFFAASESGSKGLENVAMMSVGTGAAVRDWSVFSNAGLAGWLEGLSLLSIYTNSGRETAESLLDYVFYSNPETKPYQYLRIQITAPISTEQGMVLAPFDQAILLDVYEAIGVGLAEAHRDDIEIFVRDFLFG